MRAPLVVKELREHRGVMITVAVLQLLGMGAIALGFSKTHASGLDLVRSFAIGLSTLGAWVVSHRLIAREYTSRTQLFLETLPVCRLQILATKWALGVGYVLTMVGVALAIGAWIAREHELVTAGRVGLIALRAGSFAVLVFAAFATLGLLGRYRIVCGLAVLVAVTFIQSKTNVDLKHVGPAVLIADDLAYARQGLPLAALGWTWVLIAGLVALAMLLALVREGNLQAMLAERMSHREKVFLGCVALSMLFGENVFDELKHPAPFAIASSVHAERDGVSVHVSTRSTQDAPRSQALADHVATTLAGVRAYLGLPPLAAVSIELDSELDADLYRQAKVEKRDGLVVRAHFDDPHFETADFDAWLIEGVLEHATGDDFVAEDRQWVAEGFAWWWVGRAEGADTAQRAALRGAYGVPGAPQWALLHDWFVTEERLGPCVSSGVAGSALQALVSTVGEERAKRFLVATLAWHSPKSFRTLWLRKPVERLLKEEAGLDPAALIDAWARKLAADRSLHAAELAKVPRPQIAFEVRPLGSSAREARIRIASGLSEGPYTVLSTSLGALDGPIPEGDLQRDLHVQVDPDWHPLPKTFATGERMAWTVSVRSEPLRCTLWTGLRREVLR